MVAFFLIQMVRQRKKQMVVRWSRWIRWLGQNMPFEALELLLRLLATCGRALSWRNLVSFLAKFFLVSHPSGVGELLPDVSGKDKAPSCSSADLRKSLYGPVAFKSRRRHPVKECMEHPKRDWISHLYYTFCSYLKTHNVKCVTICRNTSNYHQFVEYGKQRRKLSKH